MEFSIAMNNKLKFLLSSIIILGGYIADSNCYCMEIANNNQVNQINQNNNYLVKLCNQNKVDVDKNGNIEENVMFLQSESYIRELYKKYDKTPYGGYITATKFKLNNARTGGNPASYPTGNVYYHINNNFFSMNNKVKPNIKSLVQYIDCDYIWWMATSIKTMYAKIKSRESKILIRNLSHDELAQFPDLQNIIHNMNQNTINLNQFFKYLINKVCMLGIQYSEKLKNIIKSNDEILLNHSLILETKNVLENIQPIINWLNKFLTSEDGLRNKEYYRSFIQHMIYNIENIDQLLDSKSNNTIVIQTNDEKVLLYCNYFRSLFVLTKATCCNNIEDIVNNNFSKLVDQYYEFLDNIRHSIITIQGKLADSTNMGNGFVVDESVRLLSNLFPEDDELLNNCNNCYNIFNYLSNKISLFGIELYNEIQQCIATRNNNNIQNEILCIIAMKYKKLKKICMFLNYLQNIYYNYNNKIKQINNLFNIFESGGVYKQILRQMNSDELEKYYEEKLQTLKIYLNNITDNVNVINIWNDILQDTLSYDMYCIINGTWNGFVNVSEDYTDELQDGTSKKLKLRYNKYQKINVMNAISTLHNISRSINNINNVDDITKVIIDSAIKNCEQSIKLVKYMQNNEFKNNKFENMEDDVMQFNAFCKKYINLLNDQNMKLNENLQLLDGGTTTENLTRNLRR